MEIGRSQRQVQLRDQENVYAIKGKGSMAVPVKREGQGVRGALGDLNSNVQAQRDVNVGKVAVAAAEYEKATHNRGITKNYSYVQSKVDTGLSAKAITQPSTRPTLRREESTARLAVRAIAGSKAALKENKTSELKENKSITIQTKKCFQETKKTKLPAIKENKDSKVLKPILKESTESLGKLKLAESTTFSTTRTFSKQATGIINQKKLEQPTASLKPTRTPKLPDDIEDIDADDKNSPLHMSIYIKDIYHYLTELEVKYAIEPDHLRYQTAITGKMRATLIDWLVEVQCQFSLLLETFQLTVGLIDRYLQMVPNVQRDQLQLVGVTAMFIASKYEEIYPPEVGDFVYVTDNAYNKADILRCEWEIMSKLRFCLARPVPLSFLRRFVKAANGTAKNHHLAKYLVDLCLVEYSMAHYRPSELAAAAICLSLYLLSSKNLEDVWTPTLLYYSGYTLEHIDPIIRKIAKIVLNVENSKFKAVYRKYLDTNLAKVSTLPQLKGEAICELAKISSSS